jgi:hypothetical protein
MMKMTTKMKISRNNPTCPVPIMDKPRSAAPRRQSRTSLFLMFLSESHLLYLLVHLRPPRLRPPPRRHRHRRRVGFRLSSHRPHRLQNLVCCPSAAVIRMISPVFFSLTVPSESPLHGGVEMAPIPSGRVDDPRVSYRRLISYFSRPLRPEDFERPYIEREHRGWCFGRERVSGSFCFSPHFIL